MANTKIKDEENIVVGVDTASNPAKAEEDFVKGLLEAAAYKEDESNRETIEIKNNQTGNVMFSFTVRPVSTDEFYAARKKGVKLIPHPNNRKIKIEDETAFNTAAFHAWLIYTATIESDRDKVWGNKAIKDKYNLMLPVDSIPVLLPMGDMNRAVDLIMELSGIGVDDESEEEKENDIKN